MITADDIIASMEMILGVTPDQALVDYHLAMAFPDRAALGRYMVSTDTFRHRYEGVDVSGDHWAQRASAARARKARLQSFGPCAWGLVTKGPAGTFVIDPEDDSVGHVLLRTGEFAPHELAAARGYIGADSDVLIVGTHVGAHVVALSRHCRALVGIEANPHTFECLRMNVALNGCDNVTIFNVAAGLGGEPIRFLLNRDNSGGSKRAPLQPHRHYVYDDPAEIELETVSLDRLLGPRVFDFILMDIEGSEYFALGGMPVLLDRAGALAVEFLPFHLREVAGVSIAAFAGTIVPFFDTLLVPGRDIVAGKAAMTEALARMYEADERHDLIYFAKARPAAG